MKNEIKIEWLFGMPILVVNKEWISISSILNAFGYCEDNMKKIFGYRPNGSINYPYGRNPRVDARYQIIETIKLFSLAKTRKYKVAGYQKEECFHKNDKNIIISRLEPLNKDSEFYQRWLSFVCDGLIELSDIGSAIKYLKSGIKVRRKSWGELEYITLNSNKVFKFNGIEEIIYVATSEDLLSSDWEEFDEIIKI